MKREALSDKSGLRRFPLPAFRFPLLLAVILLLAAALRFWAMQWGFPLQKAYIDEYVTVFYAMHLTPADLNPHFFDYPSLYLYGLWAAVSAVRIFSPGEGLSLSGFLEAKSVSPILVGRFLSASFALAAVFFVYAAARRWKGETAALGAALIMALNPAHVLMSHYATPDILAASCSAAALYFWMGYLKKGADSQALAAGFLLGLGCASKYTPGFLSVGFFIWLLAQKRFSLAVRWAGAGLAGFFAGAPYLFLEPSDSLIRLRHLFAAVTAGSARETSIWLRPGRALRSSLGAVHAVTLALAAWAAVRERDDASRSVATASLAYFLGICFWSYQEERYYLSLLPGAAALAGAGWASLASDLKVRRKAAAFLAVACLLAQNALTLRRISQKDTRLEALTWIRGHLPRGSRILRFPHTPEFSSSDPYAVTVDWRGERAAEDPNRWSSQYDYVLTSSFSRRPDALEERMANFEKAMSIENPAPFFPHHPRVSLWKPRKKIVF